jgi:hypothetical protein
MIFLVGSLTFVLTACQQEKNTNNAKEHLTQKSPSTVQKSVQKETQPKRSVNVKIAKNQELKKKLSTIHKRIATQQIFEINNEQFLSKTGLFIKGATLHNVNVNQDGVIKGSIVVVMVENKDLLNEIARLGRNEKIASSTYRITFQVGQNLLEIYKRIKKLPSVKLVELEIDYTPKQKTEIM